MSSDIPNQQEQSNGVERVAVTVLLNSNCPEYTLRVILRGDGTECLASMTPKRIGNVIDPERLALLLSDNGVTTGLDSDMIAAFCAAACEGKTQDSTLIAQGTPPVAGEDGWVEFVTRTTSDRAEYQEDEAGNVDFRHLNIFGNVEEGQVIGAIHLPSDGTPGLSVTGEPIPPIPGAPVTITAGEGVRIENNEIIAEKQGRIVYIDDTVSVSDEYAVDGDVDFEVGHIDFKGFVSVKGDVLDDFNIRAEKGIKVIGAVGACVLESPGNIEVGGMSGQGKGIIRCGGNVVARYLRDVVVECDGSVIVESELINSTIRCAGIVSIPRGVISGGNIIAMGGIEARILGSRTGIQTKLVAGVHYRDIEELAELYEQLKEISLRIEKTGDKQSLTRLYAEKSEAQKQVSEIRGKNYDNANAKINVASRIMDNVTITLGNTTEVVSEVDGSFSIIENITEGGFCFFSLSSIDINTAKILASATSS